MHLALIPPTSLLEEFTSTSEVLMCLAHLILADERQAKFHRHMAQDVGATVIMDNSLWELGGAMDFDVLSRAIEDIGPQEVIVPDKFRDGPATIDMFHDFLLNICSSELQRLRETKLFVVVHGRDREEWIHTYDFFNRHPDAHVLGLPKVLDEIWHPGGRLGAVTFLERTGRINPDKIYHALGIWDDPIEILLLSGHKWIRSIDTALPVHAGLAGERFHPVLGLSRRRPKRPKNYFEMNGDSVQARIADIRHNVICARKWAHGGHYGLPSQ